jgi:hypothetical protein
MLYDDPWKIKKVLKESDVDSSSRLLLDKKSVEVLMLTVLDNKGANIDEGIPVEIWDINTNSTHFLTLKRWKSGSYVLVDGWIPNFVTRKGLKKGDEIGLHWDQYNQRFDFSVLQAYENRHQI